MIKSVCIHQIRLNPCPKKSVYIRQIRVQKKSVCIHQIRLNPCPKIPPWPQPILRSQTINPPESMSLNIPQSHPPTSYSPPPFPLLSADNSRNWADCSRLLQQFLSKAETDETSPPRSPSPL